VVAGLDWQPCPADPMEQTVEMQSSAISLASMNRKWPVSLYRPSVCLFYPSSSGTLQVHLLSAAHPRSAIADRRRGPPAVGLSEDSLGQYCVLPFALTASDISTYPGWAKSISDVFRSMEFWAE
jgi:hypothetical protein